MRLINPHVFIAATALQFSNNLVDSDGDNISPIRNSLKVHDGLQYHQKTTNLIQQFKERTGCPGISVSISCAGRTIYSSGFGFADVERLVPVQPDTLFRIASISKSITSLIVGRLWEQNKLDLDADIRQYLPEFPSKSVDGSYAKITVRSLMNHTSGIRNYKEVKKSESKSDYPEMLLQTRYNSSWVACDLFKDDPLTHLPGAVFNYSTFGFTLLSAVLERVSSQSGPAFELVSSEQPTTTTTKLDSTQSVFIEPSSRMKQTYLEYHENIIPFRSGQYKRNEKGFLENTPMIDNSYKWAGGGILSSSSDLLRLANHLSLLYSDELISPGVVGRDTLRELWTVSTKNPKELWQPGIGWFLSRRSGAPLVPSNESICPDRLYVMHTGGSVGGTTVLLLSLPCCAASTTESINVADYRLQVAHLQAPIGVVVLTNLEDVGGISELAVSLAELATDHAIQHTLPEKPDYN